MLEPQYNAKQALQDVKKETQLDAKSKEYMNKLSVILTGKYKVDKSLMTAVRQYNKSASDAHDYGAEGYDTKPNNLRAFGVLMSELGAPGVIPSKQNIETFRPKAMNKITARFKSNAFANDPGVKVLLTEFMFREGANGAWNKYMKNMDIFKNVKWDKNRYFEQLAPVINNLTPQQTEKFKTDLLQGFLKERTGGDSLRAVLVNYLVKDRLEVEKGPIVNELQTYLLKAK